MLIPRLIGYVMDGRPIQLQCTDGIRINPVYVTDAAQAVVHSLTLTDSQKINVGGPDILSMRQIGEIIGEAIGRKPLFETDDKQEPRNLVGDIHKMSQLLLKPGFHLRDGILQMIKEL